VGSPAASQPAHLTAIIFDAALTYGLKPFYAAGSGLSLAAWNEQGKGVYHSWMTEKFWY
jgi:hypothetical protein